MSICPIYSNELCVLKTISNPGLATVFFKLPLADIKNGWDHDCKGLIENCCFAYFSTWLSVASGEITVADPGVCINTGADALVNCIVKSP